MRVAVVLSVFCFAIAYGSPQFGFGGLGNFGANLPRPNLANIPIVGRLSNLAPIPNLSSVRDFGEFVAQSRKTYASAAEKTLREGIFSAKNQILEAHNAAFAAGKESFTMAHNFFSDLSTGEFLKGLTGNKKSAKGEQLKTKNRKSAPKVQAPVPESFDWREHGAVTPVKWQGLECGACWSFGVTGAIEGHYFAKNKKLVSLSEQNLIDCSSEYGNTGCDGGYQEYGLNYVVENNGIAAEEIYPYVEKDQTCSYNNTIKAVSIKAFGTVEPKNEKQMKEIIATMGPLVCSVNAAPDSFQLYEKGIYSDAKCNEEEVNHTILVVGYGKDEHGKEYWIIKNSWTDKWGEKGYMKLPRNANSFCGIADECSYPIV